MAVFFPKMNFEHFLHYTIQSMRIARRLCIGTHSSDNPYNVLRYVLSSMIIPIMMELLSMDASAEP
jgi:hypothetical protein